jgi:hypothetical protein
MALGKADDGDMKNIVQMVCDSVMVGYRLLEGKIKEDRGPEVKKR